MISVRNGRPGRARLAALGAYVPDRVVTNAEMEERVDTSDGWIVSRTGIRQRRFAAPDLLAACSGFVYGLAQASALVESGIARTVLVVGAEALSRLTDQTDRATCVIFADGAGAALVTSADPGEVTGFLGFELGADGRGAEHLLIPAGGSRMPLAMAGSPADGYIRILDHAAERLGIPSERLFSNIERYGNNSSASIALALTEARDAGRLSPGDLLLLIGFGGGLTWASTIVRYEPATWEPDE